MKHSLLSLAMAATLVSTNSFSMGKVNDEASLVAAIADANSDTAIQKIVFERNASIVLNAPVIYTGTQALTLLGNNATIDGSAAGSFVLDNDLTAITTDGTLVFNTAGDITIKRLTVADSATRGIVVNIPDLAEGDDIDIRLDKVKVVGSALYGVHIDDNADEFDDGTDGSAIGVNLRITGSSFTGNGTGAIDFDGVRVDERAEGDIESVIINTHIDGNGGDGIELDEAGSGDVDSTMINVTLNGNGFFNEEDLDDGFDIDEADEGDIEARLINVTVRDNMDEGLDFDEEGEGDVELKLVRVQAVNNADEGIKVDEEDNGDIEARLKRVSVIASGDDGIQFTELGDGEIEVVLKRVDAIDNAKYGIKMEQWVVEDEPAPVEPAGSLRVRRVTLSGNESGDDIKINNVDIR